MDRTVTLATGLLVRSIEGLRVGLIVGRVDLLTALRVGENVGLKHEDAPFLEIVPRGQIEQKAAPSREKVPPIQSLQGDPRNSDAVPAGQLKHTPDPCNDVVPRAHAVHDSEPGAEICPAKHFMHSDARLNDFVPALHGVH